LGKKSDAIGSDECSQAGALTSNEKLTILDVGCGGGFDHKANLQSKIATRASRYIGVEPDPDIELDNTFTETHRTLLEHADIEPNSVDLAFSVMVLEHVENAELFWQTIHTLLKPGGVFWGFTVDSRHWFVGASALLERMGLKNIYLNLLHGKRGEARYENYGVYYKSNSPKQIETLTAPFSASKTFNFHKEGHLDFYIPKGLKWMVRMLDRYEIARDKPGSVIAIRVQK